MARVIATSALALAAVAAAPRTAAARPASTGFFAEGGLGALGFIGAAKDDSAVGPSLDMRIGYDLFSWLSVGAHLAGSTHEATTPPPPTGQYYQLYRGGGDIRLGGLIGRIALFVEGGIGAGMMSSNVLEKVMITKVGQHYSLALDAGAGLAYQLENRHYAIGLAGDFVALPGFASEQAITGRIFLRYTY